MDWRKAPILIRELRIAYMIPELRTLVAKSIGICFVRLAYGVVCVVFVAPILAICLTGQALSAIGEWLGEKIDPIWNPSRWLRARELENLKASHEIVSVKEIRRRAYGEQAPEVLPK